MTRRRYSGYGGEKGNQNDKDFYWRDDSKGVHGRVQGVIYDDDNSFESGSSNRRESFTRDGYSLTISKNDKGRRVFDADQRQDSSYGANRKKSNGSDYNVRQEKGDSGSQRRPSAHGGYEGSSRHRRTSQSGSFRGRAASVEVRGAVGASCDSSLTPNSNLGKTSRLCASWMRYVSSKCIKKPRWSSRSRA